MSDQRKYAVAAETTKVTTALKTSSAGRTHFPSKKGENVSSLSCGSHDGCVTLKPQVQQKQQAIMERTVKIADGEERRSSGTSGATGKDLWSGL